MTYPVWALCLLTSVSTTLFAQRIETTITDSFSDNDFSHNPTWVGTDSSFVTLYESVSLNEDLPGEGYLAVQSSAVEEATWQVSLQLAFNPSGSNFARVYLISDKQDLRSALNGYFVLIGGSSDEVALYRQAGTKVTKIIDGPDGALDLDTVSIRVRVDRDEEGQWKLYYRLDGAATDSLGFVGQTMDDIFISSAYSGIYCRFTSTRAKHFRFDDVVIHGYSSGQISESAKYKDVLITEVFPDPSPSVELPSAEFVELFNRTDSPIRLSGWTLSDGSTTATLVGRKLEPGEYLVLCSSSFSELFEPYGSVLGLSGFPSFNNSSDHVILRSSEGILIDSIRYEDTWYRDSSKKSGGWTLELIDPSNNCSDERNWGASVHETGGTPGIQNSIYANMPDLTGPLLESAVPTTPTSVVIQFDEQLAIEDILPGQFNLFPSGNVVQTELSSVRPDQVLIELEQPLTARIAYTLSVKGLRDCNHNAMNPSTVGFGLPELADSLDVVVNEILFNPHPGGFDFLEVYNNSDKYINLQGWGVANWEEGNLADVLPITNEPLLLEPRSFFFFSEHPDLIAVVYPSTALEASRSAQLPAMNDDQGSIALVSPEGLIIDATKYSEDFHSELVRNKEGVSLERIGPGKSSITSSNWSSASARVGYASPGTVNSSSVHELMAPGTERLHLMPEVFEPISGTPNHTVVTIKMDKPGFVGKLMVIDLQGRIIKTLASNELLGLEDIYKWDGDTDAGQQATIGSYIVWLEAFNSEGEKIVSRSRVAIAGRF